MTFETRDNSGSLFRNDKATSDRHPTHKGQARIGNVDYWVSGWVKEAGPNAKTPGARFFSLAFEPKQQQSAAQEDIPFGADSPPASRGGQNATQAGQGPSRASQAATGAPQGGSPVDDLDDIPF